MRRHWLPRAYLGFNRRLMRLFQFCRGVVDGIWLGLATRELVHQTDYYFYRSQGQYVSDEYTLSGLFDWESRVVQDHFPDCREVVVTGAGGGREVLALAREGRRVTGFDPNEDMVTFGRKLIGGRDDVSLHLSPRDGWPELPTVFDGAVIGWSSYSHIFGRDRRIDFLRETRRHLYAGAPLIVSVYERPATKNLYHRVVHRISRPLRSLRKAEPAQLGDGFSPMYNHCFSRGELADELSEAGFTMTDWWSRPFPHAVAIAVDLPAEVGHRGG